MMEPARLSSEKDDKRRRSLYPIPYLNAPNNSAMIP